MNNVFLVGKVVEGPVIKEVKPSYKLARFILRVAKPYNNKDTEKEYELFQVNVWQKLIDEIDQKHFVDKYIGVKGRLSANNFSKDNGEILYRPEVVAEKISYIE